MLWLDLLLGHFLFELLWIHDYLEHEVILIVEALQLLLLQLIYFVALLFDLLGIHFAFDVRPDVLQRDDIVLDQDCGQVE